MSISKNQQRFFHAQFDSPLRWCPAAFALTLLSIFVFSAAAFAGEDAEDAVTDQGEGIDEETEKGHRSAPHAPDPDKDSFHFTVLRTWLFRDFLPKSDDSTILGIEAVSAWGWGDYDVTNISYIELVDYPRVVPGMPPGNPEGEFGAATGVTDLLSAFLFSKKSPHHGPHHFAYGFATQLPTGSDGTISSGKWSLGPAIEYEYHKGKFYAAFVALQLWSVAGDADRKSVSMMMIKPMITYDLSEKWKAVYMPYGISIYWNKEAGQKVYLPLGGGLQRNFRLGSQEMAASLQFFKYVVRPDKGSEYDLRFMLEFDF